MSSDSGLPARSAFSTTLQIVSVVSFTFVCYLTIGLPIAVLPGFVHEELGLSAVVAGAVISVQYLATLASRPLAGRCADTLGPQRTVLRGLVGCGASGALLLVALLFVRWPAVSLVLLTASRLVLGVGESLVGTGAILWGIGRVGVAHNARVISWNGIATYGALAIGAPLGVAIAHSLNAALLGVLTVALAAGGYWLALRVAPVPLVH
ncbi:MFS transporter, partial [Burkholderia glumae]